MYRLLIVVVSIIFLAKVSLAQETASVISTKLPDFSMIGNFLSLASIDKNKQEKVNFLVEEIEFAVQGYIYPQIKADVFFAFHIEENEEINFELEEAYLIFLNLLWGIQGKAGRMFLDFGKINKQHSEEWYYFNKPTVLKNFLGHESLSGDGAMLSYLFPLPFFMNLKLGVYNSTNHLEEDEEERPSQEFSLIDLIASSRLWSSFEISENSELEIGVSGLLGKDSNFGNQTGDVKVLGIDLTYKVWLSAYQALIIQNEALYLHRKISTMTIKRWGFYSYLGFRFDKYWETAVRYDLSENTSKGNKIDNIILGIITNHLTEKVKLRFEYAYKFREQSHNLYIQLNFGIGPHSHTLK